MKRFKTNNENFHYEDTGIIRIHNYPAEPRTLSYITRVYRKWEKGVIGFTEIEGDPIYLKDLPHALFALAEMAGIAQNVLSSKLPREKFLKEIEI